MRISALVLATILAGTALAAAPAIEMRQKTMKSLGILTKEGSEMIRGVLPFDAARARIILESYVAAAEAMPTLFPEDSREGGYTKAMPEVWTDPAGFAAAIASFRADAVAALPAAGTPESFRPAFLKATGHCKSCHSDYRE